MFLAVSETFRMKPSGIVSTTSERAAISARVNTEDVPLDISTLTADAKMAFAASKSLPIPTKLFGVSFKEKDWAEG